jgi:hypothetical protein
MTDQNSSLNDGSINVVLLSFSRMESTCFARIVITDRLVWLLVAGLHSSKLFSSDRYIVTKLSLQATLRNSSCSRVHNFSSLSPGAQNNLLCYEFARQLSLPQNRLRGLLHVHENCKHEELTIGSTVKGILEEVCDNAQSYLH